MIKVAIYARVSTRDKDQDPETQLYLLRNYADQRGWERLSYRQRGHLPVYLDLGLDKVRHWAHSGAYCRMISRTP